VIKFVFAFILALILPSAAFAGATKDCANRKLSPKRIIWACTVVIEANPKVAFAYVARADASLHVSTDNFNALLADYSKAIELDPTLAAAYLGRARVNFSRGTFKSRLEGVDSPQFNVLVLDDLNRAVELEPDNVRALRWRASQLMSEDKLDQALADYETVVRLKPDDDDSYTGRARAHFELGHYAQAIADYDKSFYLGKKRSAFYQAQRGLAHSLNGDDLLALKDYDIALKDKANAFDTYLNRAFSLYNLGRYEEASNALNAERETVSDISWKLLRFHALYQAKLHRDPAYLGIQEALEYDDWYKPLANMHTERTDAHSVLTAMEQQPAKNKCIAFFFVGQWQIYKQDTAGAKASFQNAIDICPLTKVERAAAMAALKKL
jgi:tetratricopeptide (TPR) repeat protein